MSNLCAIITHCDHVDSLATDHEHARLLAEGLERAGFEVDGPYTNTLFVTLDDRAQREIGDLMKERGIEIFVRGAQLRLITHRDLARADFKKVIESFEAFAGS